jgi:hypothetical protein
MENQARTCIDTVCSAVSFNREGFIISDVKQIERDNTVHFLFKDIKNTKTAQWMQDFLSAFKTTGVAIELTQSAKNLVRHIGLAECLNGLNEQKGVK